jgi:hypothetical protein
VTAPDPRRLPPRPPSEVEWEELLVRIDVAPRALRVAVEDAGGRPEAARALRDALREERLLQETLAATAEGREAPAGVDGEAEEDDAEALARRFQSLRARTFAMVQRRGLGVWEWRVRGGPRDGATSFQLLQEAAARDGRTLAAVRAAGAAR